MPLDTRPRLRTPFTPELDLPPVYRLVTLREVGDAFTTAQSIAAAEGAGTLVWVGRFDLVEFAVVLEPDDPLRIARRAHYAAMSALADALAVHAPPEKPIHFTWPDSILVDGALVGGGRFAWPPGTDENSTPPWVVFGATIRLVSMSGDEAGLNPMSAALEDEGFDDLGAGRLVESFARHLMVAVDEWQEKGFSVIARNYLSRLSPETGVRRELDETGDLLVRRVGQTEVERRALTPALATPSWLDPQTGGPRR